MAVTLPLPEAFHKDVRDLVDANSKLSQPLLGLSERTQNAWGALEDIAAGKITDDDAMKAALCNIRRERRDDARLREFYQKHQETIDTLAPKKTGLGGWLVGD